MTRFSLGDLPAGMQQQARAQMVSTPVEAIAPRETKRKYRNAPIEIDGKRFDSKLEGRCYSWLKARWQRGDISWFARQVSFDLPGDIKYRCDFLAAVKGGGVEVIDAKGFLTATSHMKIKQMKALYAIEVILWSDRPKAGM